MCDCNPEKCLKGCPCSCHKPTEDKKPLPLSEVVKRARERETGHREPPTQIQGYA